MHYFSVRWTVNVEVEGDLQSQKDVDLFQPVNWTLDMCKKLPTFGINILVI